MASSHLENDIIRCSVQCPTELDDAWELDGEGSRRAANKRIEQTARLIERSVVDGQSVRAGQPSEVYAAATAGKAIVAGGRSLQLLELNISDRAPGVVVVAGGLELKAKTGREGVSGDGGLLLSGHAIESGRR